MEAPLRTVGGGRAAPARGTQRRNWLQTLVSDGFVIVRHPEWDEAIRMAEDAAVNIRMYAQ